MAPEHSALTTTVYGAEISKWINPNCLQEWHSNGGSNLRKLISPNNFLKTINSAGIQNRLNPLLGQHIVSSVMPTVPFSLCHGCRVPVTRRACSALRGQTAPTLRTKMLRIKRREANTPEIHGWKREELLQNHTEKGSLKLK